MKSILARIVYEPVFLSRDGFYAWMDPTEESFPVLSYVSKFIHREAQSFGIHLSMENSTELHTTLMYSNTLPRGINDSMFPGDRVVDVDGNFGLDFFSKSLVLLLDSPELHSIHTQLTGLGFSHSYPEFRPHVTLGKLDNETDPKSIRRFLHKLNRILIPNNPPISLGPQIFCSSLA